MPELPEVERARKLIQETCVGYTIADVDSVEDKIVYTAGTDHEEFADEIKGRTITGCERKGKTFWMTLSGDGRYPVMHFGMTGMIQLKGQEPTWYRRRPKESADVWPPKFYKFVLKLQPQEGSVASEARELAFIDARRLGRLRLVPSPVTAHPPVSLLGFDPILSHPSFEEFQELLKKKKGTIKGVIMDQAFSAGVGNWVADEVLFQSRIHPSTPVPLLTPDQILALHDQLHEVCQTAVDVNADSKSFPESWLFRWRWGKGAAKKKKGKKAKEQDEEGEEDVEPAGKSFLALPDGTPATIKFIEVGGRTTALVEEVQKMPEGVEIKPKITKGSKKKVKEEEEEEDADSEDDDEEKPEKPARSTTKRQRTVAAKKRKAPDVDVTEEEEEEQKPAPKSRKTSKKDVKPPKATTKKPSTRPSRASARKRPLPKSPESSELSDLVD
ncbi:formamidopyrimidine-DNA glycosylase [Cryptococcus floricola]|uniref:Formamidopyrimidine-DNA glycosylase n=1 Tax=Cryptococcus floricola TaxID=2591691 RepID=A0A5D3ALW7_9TREE|nr:formamidopyrimidine-DNA glycosylase [Cryptococcus floricola]